MRTKITVLVLLALAGCSSFKEYAQDVQVTAHRAKNAYEDRTAGTTDYAAEGHREVAILDRTSWALRTDIIPSTKFVGGQHTNFVAMELAGKYPDFFKTYAMGKKQRFWISWRTFEGTFNTYQACPPPARNGAGLRDLFKAREEWEAKVKREKIQCLKEVKPMMLCEASVGLVPIDEEKPKVIYSSTSDEKNEWKVSSIKRADDVRRVFAAGCINDAIEKMVADYKLGNNR